ncbi:MAG: hypothetical protein ACI87W_003117 [Halieaceae bacterium]|jgi:hypothetical protein
MRQRPEPVPEGTSSGLSTSALAKRLKLPIQQLFVTLRDYGWIERQEPGPRDRQGGGWLLSGKGELHGGSYQQSQRFGRYIIWPESLLEHPLITAIESNQRITPGAMRRYYPHLNARQINRTLAEIGLQRATHRGWQLSALGARFGGRQDADEDNALLTISWPHELVDNDVIHRELNRLLSVGKVAEPAGTKAPPSETAVTAADTGDTGDLFSEGDAQSAVGERALRCGLDGHRLESLLQLRVCDWLYQAQLAHAQHRQLPLADAPSADFYVPAAGLYIECWEREVPTAELTRRLRTRELCRELKLIYLEIAADDIERVDDILTAQLTELGIYR